MALLSGAEMVVDYLIKEKVPYVVGLCGHGNLGLLDALYDRREEIATISVHHESLAGLIADCYYRVALDPIATFTSCGPGSANLPVALGSALMDDSAFLAITGNVATTQFNRAPFQETGRHHQADFASVVRPYVKRSFQATRPEQLPLMLRQAFGLMRRGRPGPVHLDVPLDVWVERADVEVPDPTTWRTAQVPAPGASAAELDAIADVIDDAERIVVVAGSGVVNGMGEEALLALAQRLNVPVATSPLGKAAIPGNHPLSIGATGRNGTLTANRATRTADLVLAFGTRFDDRSTSSWMDGYTYRFPATRLVHVHIDPDELGRNFPPTVAVQANPATVLAQLAARDFSDDGRRGRWLERIDGWRVEWAQVLGAHDTSEAIPIHPRRLVAELRRALPTDGILVSDVGVHHNWIVQNWITGTARSLQQSWGFASMGFGLGGVLGAKLAAPDRAALAVVGDGGFLMLPSVVATAVQYGIGATWVVWNNGGFMSIRDQQRGYFGAGRELATEFRYAETGAGYRADFAAMSAAMGGEGMVVDHPADLASALQTALASPHPTVVDVRVDDRVTPAAVASWDLPPLPHPEPTVGWPDA